MSIRTILGCFIFLLVSAPVVCAAESAWTVRCSDSDGTAEKECEMFQRLVVADTGARVVEVAFGFPSHKPGGRGVVVLPLGVLLAEGATLKIDDNPLYRFDIRYCTAEGCFAFIGINDAFINQLKKGNEAVVSFKALDEQPVNTILSLSGFTRAFEKINR